VETPLEDFMRLAREWPRVKFVLAHWGGLLPLRDPAAEALPNVHYDTAASPLIYDDSVWERFLAAVPDSRVLFGSDYPLNLYPKLDPEPRMERFIAEAKDAHAPENVMRDNAARLLAL
jgi:predicted TIM-barrel fold metal-dependent hydrolase